MASRLRSRNRFGGLTQHVMLRNSAIAAAQRNGASLWFAGAPGDLAGFVFQDSTGITPATGTDPIGRLVDRAGSNAATQATAANKPTLELQANGFYGMRFDGTNDHLETGLIVAGSSTSVVSGFVDGVASSSSCGARGVSDRISFGANLIGAPNAGTGTIPYSAISPGGSMLAPGVLSMTIAQPAQTAAFWFNGASQTGRTSVGTTSPGFGTAIGATNQSGSFNSFWGGVICLMCQSASAMPDADRIAIERFAALLSGATYA